MMGFTLSDISQDDMCEIVQSWLNEKFSGDGLEPVPTAKFITADPRVQAGDPQWFSIQLKWEDSPASESSE